MLVSTCNSIQLQDGRNTAHTRAGIAILNAVCLLHKHDVYIYSSSHLEIPMSTVKEHN